MAAKPDPNDRSDDKLRRQHLSTLSYVLLAEVEDAGRQSKSDMLRQVDAGKVLTERHPPRNVLVTIEEWWQLAINRGYLDEADQEDRRGLTEHGRDELGRSRGSMLGLLGPSLPALEPYLPKGLGLRWMAKLFVTSADAVSRSRLWDRFQVEPSLRHAMAWLNNDDLRVGLVTLDKVPTLERLYPDLGAKSDTVIAARTG